MSKGEKAAAAFINLILAVGLTLLNGFVWWMLWRWFVVPLGAPSIAYWHAFGLSLFTAWMRIYSSDGNTEELKRGWERSAVLAGKAIGMGLVLFIAWLVQFGVSA